MHDDKMSAFLSRMMGTDVQYDSELREKLRAKPLVQNSQPSASASATDDASAPEDVQRKLQELREEAEDIIRCSRQLRENVREGRLSPEHVLTPHEALQEREQMLKNNTDWYELDDVQKLKLQINEESQQRWFETRRFYMTSLVHCEEEGVCSSCLALEKFDDKISAGPEADINKQVIANATEIVETLLDGSVYSIERKGSTSNNLKVGRVDELDLLVTLEGEVVKEEDGWQLVNDTPDLSFDVGRSAVSDTSLQTGWQVRRLYTDRDCASAEQRNKSGFKYLIAQNIKRTFEVKLQGTVADIGKHSEHTDSVTTRCRYVWTGDSGVIYFSPNLHYGVKLDIVPCVPFIRSDGTIVKLVPNITFGHWRLVNSDPPELQNPVVSQAIRIVKGLRDCSANPDVDEDCYCTRMFDVIVKDTDEYRRLGQVSHLVTSHCGRAQVAPDTSGMLSSYAIMGTVVKSFKQSPGQPLCSLVADSLVNFQHINPDGKLLSRMIIGDRDLRNKEPLLFELCFTLRHIIGGASKPDESVREVIPIFYLRSPPDLEDVLKQTTCDQKVVFKCPALKKESKKRTQRQTTPAECGAMSWADRGVFSDHFENVFTVYRVNATLFTSSLLQRTALGEKALREAVQELQDTHQNQDLHVAVRTLSTKDTIFRCGISSRPWFDKLSSLLLEDFCKSLCSDYHEVWKTVSM